MEEHGFPTPGDALAGPGHRGATFLKIASCIRKTAAVPRSHPELTWNYSVPSEPGPLAEVLKEITEGAVYLIHYQSSRSRPASSFLASVAER